MRISDLQKLLARVKRKHGDIEILERRYSDYMLMDNEPVSDWEVVQATPRQEGSHMHAPAYYMRDHHSLTDEQRKAMNFQPYLLYKGN